MPSGRIIVDWSAEKTGGKFASKDSIEEALIEAIDGANPGSITPDDGEYEVDWSVEAEPDQKKAKAKPKLTAAAATPGLSIPVTSLIRGYLKIEHEQFYTDNVLDELMRDLKQISESFPKITAQEKSKLEAGLKS